MKKTALFIVLSSMLLLSCSKEGKDGSIYLKISENTFYKTLEYYDDNEQVPANNFQFDRDYLCYPGTYKYFYRIMLHDSTVLAFEGEYTLEADPGEDGGFMKSAKIGKTRFYEFKCTEEGSEFYYDYVRLHPNSNFELPDLLFQLEGNTRMLVSRKVRLISP